MGSAEGSVERQGERFATRVRCFCILFLSLKKWEKSDSSGLRFLEGRI